MKTAPWFYFTHYSKESYPDMTEPILESQPTHHTNSEKRPYLSANAMHNIGLKGILNWARTNKQHSMKIVYQNGATSNGKLTYIPPGPGKRESLMLTKSRGGQAIAIAGAWAATNDINPQIRILLGRK